MKLISRLGTFGLILCCLMPLITTQTARAQASETYLPGDTPPPSDRPIADAQIETFYRELAPYGRWIDTHEYGRVWIPKVEAGFMPYATKGHWIVTSYGNTWVSDYPWGWAAFHYGRWYWSDTLGWVWVPGKIWGPAWVVWRTGGGYYGWAPLGPSVTININIPIGWWTYAPQTYITSTHIYNYYLPAPRVVEVHNNTTVIVNNYRVNNRTYVYGPKRQEIEKVTNSNVTVYRIDRVAKPGTTKVEGRSVRIYQPTVTTELRKDRSTSVTTTNNQQNSSIRQRTYYRDGNAASGGSTTIDTQRIYRQNSSVAPTTTNTGLRQDRERYIERSRSSQPESTSITTPSPNRSIERREYSRPDLDTSSSATDRQRSETWNDRGGSRHDGRSAR
jgi:hypothetical protein